MLYFVPYLAIINCLYVLVFKLHNGNVVNVNCTNEIIFLKLIVLIFQPSEGRTGGLKITWRLFLIRLYQNQIAMMDWQTSKMADRQTGYKDNIGELLFKKSIVLYGAPCYNPIYARKK